MRDTNPGSRPAPHGAISRRGFFAAAGMSLTAAMMACGGTKTSGRSGSNAAQAGPAASPGPAPPSYFPPKSGDAWETVTPASLGWHQPAIDDLLSFLEARATTGFVVLHGGRVAIESYWQGPASIHRPTSSRCRRA